MFRVTTTKSSNATGRGVVVAKCNGKQRTVNYDHSKSPDWNHGAAAGTLLDALLDDRQKAMLRHPSGGQRVAHEHISDNGGRMRFEVNV